MRCKDARLEPEQIDYINAHGTSTDVGDKAETMAIKRAFGEHAYKVAVSSTKSMTGHLLGGAGGLEAGITVLAIRDQVAPPTINLRVSRPGLRSGLRAESRAADEDRIRAVEQFRFRRHQRLPDFQAILGIGGQVARTRSGEVACLIASNSMKIVVAIKQVPARDSQLRIASSGKWIEEDDLTHEINEPDAYALEEGLQLKEKHGGEVVALCFGPARAGADHPRSAGQRRRPRASTSKKRIPARTIRWPPRA